MKKFHVSFEYTDPDGHYDVAGVQAVIRGALRAVGHLERVPNIDVVEDADNDDVDPSNGVPLRGVDNGELVEVQAEPSFYRVWGGAFIAEVYPASQYMDAWADYQSRIQRGGKMIRILALDDQSQIIRCQAEFIRGSWNGTTVVADKGGAQ